MSEGGLERIDACVFDAYGTLFDVHSAVAAHRQRVGAGADALSGLWRQKQLEYTWLRSLMGRYADFWQITGDALDFAMESHGIEDPGLREDLMRAYRSLEAYPEVPGVLGRLKGSGKATAILSNGSPRMLADAVTGAGVGAQLDAVLSVDELGIYKPDPRVYQLAVDRLDVPVERIAFLSSNGWDACGAASFGFRVLWVNRGGAVAERLPVAPEREIPDLTPLPGLIGV